MTLTQVRPHSGAGSAQRRSRHGLIRLYATWALLVISLLAWRKGDYYSGGLDPVVAAKAVVSILALSLAASAPRRFHHKIHLGSRTPLLIVAFVLVSCMGAWAAGSLMAAGILTVRVLITFATVALLVVAYPAVEFLKSGVAVLGVIGVVLALGGIGSLATRGRLYSTLIIPVSPNQIAILLAPAAIWLVWRMLQAPCTVRDMVCLAVLLSLTWLTGSRTGLLAVAVGIFVVIVHAPRLPRGWFIVAVAAIPGVFYLVAFTGILQEVVYREGTGNVATLNSRTIAWSAAFDAPMSLWQHLFGAGLDEKTVAVSGQYWANQVVDSSWVSAYIQAGVIGMCLLGVWAITSTVAAFRSPSSRRGLLLALVLYAVVRSVLESGLVGSSVLFVIMLAPVLVMESSTGEASAIDDSDEVWTRGTSRAGT